MAKGPQKTLIQELRVQGLGPMLLSLRPSIPSHLPRHDKAGPRHKEHRSPRRGGAQKALCHQVEDKARPASSWGLYSFMSTEPPPSEYSAGATSQDESTSTESSSSVNGDVSTPSRGCEDKVGSKLKSAKSRVWRGVGAQ